MMHPTEYILINRVDVCWEIVYIGLLTIWKWVAEVAIKLGYNLFSQRLIQTGEKMVPESVV